MKSQINRLLWALAVTTVIGCNGGGSTEAPEAPEDRNGGNLQMSKETFLLHGPQLAPLSAVVTSTIATIDGRPVPIWAITSNLDGSVVTMRGTLRNTVDGIFSEASSIDIEHALIGRIESLDLANVQFTSMGQRVYITDATQVHLSALTDLAVGDRVSVSGFSSSSGDVIATMVNRETTGGDFLLRGILDTAPADTLRIGGMTLDLTDATFLGFPDGRPNVGDPVLVFANREPVGGVLVAASLRYLGDPLDYHAADAIYEEGTLTARPTRDEVYIGGRPVDCAYFHCETLPPDTPIGAVIHVRVDPMFRITPYISIAAVVSRSLVLTGPLDAVDPVRGSFTVLGLPAHTLPSTQIFNDGKRVAMDDLRIGDTVYLSAGTVGNTLVTEEILGIEATPPSLLAPSYAISLVDPEIRVAGEVILTTSGTAVTEECYGARDQIWLFDPSHELESLFIQIERTDTDERVATQVTVTTELKCD